MSPRPALVPLKFNPKAREPGLHLRIAAMAAWRLVLPLRSVRLHGSFETAPSVACNPSALRRETMTTRRAHHRPVVFAAVATAVAVLASSSTFAQPAPPLTIECEVLDAVTLLPRNGFSTGEELILRLLIDVPPEAMKGQIDVKTSVAARIHGFKFSLGLQEFSIDVPDADTRQEIEGFEDLESRVPDGFFLEREALLKLPDRLPDSTYTLKAVASSKSFGGPGGKRMFRETCKQAITVTRS
jgi:hypothetical protein